MLKDRFNRVHDYLRISLTDNCNFRCTYCMPDENVALMPRAQLMQSGEIFDIAKTFVELGVKKIRLTGGEPLVRKDFSTIVSQLATLPVELVMTTNGLLLDQYLPTLQQCGMKSVNISLDTLQKDRFRQITQRDAFDRVWENILRCIDAGMRVKLNVVLMKDVNDDEVAGFLDITRELPVHVRFIEYMPFDQNGWNKDKVVGSDTVLKTLSEKYTLYKLQDGKNDTDKKFGIFGHKGTICFISTMTDSFCGTCNRIRLTADGKVKNCLFGAEEFDILGALRGGEDVTQIIRTAIDRKHARTGGQFTDYAHIQPEQLENRSMIKIGG